MDFKLIRARYHPLCTLLLTNSDGVEYRSETKKKWLDMGIVSLEPVDFESHAFPNKIIVPADPEDGRGEVVINGTRDPHTLAVARFAFGGLGDGSDKFIEIPIDAIRA